VEAKGILLRIVKRKDFVENLEVAGAWVDVGQRQGIFPGQGIRRDQKFQLGFVNKGTIQKSRFVIRVVLNEFEQKNARLPVVDAEPEKKPVRLAQLRSVVNRGPEFFDIGSPKVTGTEMLNDPIKRLAQLAGFDVGVLKDIHFETIHIF